MLLDDSTKEPKGDKRRSRNDLFSQSFGSQAPHVSRSTQPSPDRTPVLGPLLPREIIDYLPQLHWPTVDRAVQLRWNPSALYLLGEGKHSSVYLGAFKRTKDAMGPWSLCAAKRVHPDPESQQAALNEVYLLSKLDSCPYIIHLLAYKEEDDRSVQFLDPEATFRRRSAKLGQPDSPPQGSVPMSTRPHMSQQQFHESPIRLTHSLNEGQPVRRYHSLRQSPASGPVEQTFTKTPEERSRMVLVQELCAQGTLASFIRRCPNQLGRLLWLKLARQLVTALAFCHSNAILHGDLKSANILLTESLDVRLADFGTSFPLSDKRRPLSGSGLGTTNYSAPELVRLPPQPFGIEVDIFSLGLCLTAMLTGIEPYTNMRPVEQALWVSKGAFWEWQQQRQQLHDSSELADAISFQSRRTSTISINTVGSSESMDSASSFLNGQKTGRISREAAAKLLDQPLATWEPPVSSMASEDPSESILDSRSSRATSFSMQTYSDGRPVQQFLSGSETVPEGVLRLLARMTAPLAADRPTIQEVDNSLAVF